MAYNKIKSLLLFFLFCLNLVTKAQNTAELWVQSKLQTMTQREKIAQLFMVRAMSNQDQSNEELVRKLIEKEQIGGLCFFQGTAEKQIQLINEYQKLSKIPLLISMDAEHGPAMRLKSDAIAMPKQITLGALQNNELIYEMGKEVANQLHAVGVHMNFAPVVDINSNANNPVINERSFGSDRNQVTGKAFAYMRGMHDGGVMTCLKHFPGHGDTDLDSHYDLPQLIHQLDRLDSVELYPYRALLQHYPDAVMVAHMNIPSLDSLQKIPSSLSKKIVHDLLRDKLNYQGLIITDALEMKGVLNYTVDVELSALQAGNDVVLLSQKVEAAIDRIEQALKNKEWNEDELNDKVKRVLLAKYKFGLYERKELSYQQLKNKLNSANAKKLKAKIYREAVTLYKDQESSIPVRELNKKYLVVSLGVEDKPLFQKRFEKFSKATFVQFDHKQSWKDQLTNKVNSADEIWISIHKYNYVQSKNYGLHQETVQAIQELCDSKKTHIVLFGNPYISSLFPTASSIILSYEDNPLMQDITAQMIFGTDPIQGLVPVSIGMKRKSIHRPSLYRLGYSLPEEQNMDSKALEAIDAVVAEIVKEKASPGGQVVVARHGKIIYENYFGYLRYDSLIPVQEETIYDLASLTKITATAPSLMILNDRGEWDSKKKISADIPSLIGTNKEQISYKDFLLHQARFISWIPFYKASLISPDTFNLQDPIYYRKEFQDSFQLKLCDSLYMRNDFLDTLYQKIYTSRLHDSVKYLYSDLGFYFIPELIRKYTQLSFTQFLQSEFYSKIGLHNTLFNPRDNGIDPNHIAPSEDDRYWRYREIQGYVHDMGAAITHGVSGHAGLFSNAKEVAQIMQTYLNLGYVGGKELISGGSIRIFTSRDPLLKRRALCFDLPELEPNENPYVSALASPKTFGHQGFTGTCTWADPENDLIFVFLSNRTYPNSNINKLHRNRYRTKIQDIIYKARLDQ